MYVNMYVKREHMVNRSKENLLTDVHQQFTMSECFFPLALLAALRGGRARVHEKEEVK